MSSFLFALLSSHAGSEEESRGVKWGEGVGGGTDGTRRRHVKMYRVEDVDKEGKGREGKGIGATRDAAK